VILFVEVPAAEVDVNVHPAKTEVRFLHEAAMIGIVREAVTKAIEASHTVTRLAIRPGQGRQPEARREDPGRAEWRSRSGQIGPSEPSYSDQGARERGQSAFDTTRAPGGLAASGADEFRLESPEQEPATERQPGLGLSFAQSGGAGDRQGSVGGGEGPEFPDTAASAELSILLAEQFTEGADPSGACASGVVLKGDSQAVPLPDLGHGIKPMGQIRDSYIVATDEEGLLLIDQHVAHERILFERFRDRRLAPSTESQPMLVPQTIDLAPAESEAFAVVQQELEAMGIETIELSGRTIAIKATPAGLNPGDAVAVVRDVLSAVERERGNQTLDVIRDEIAASLACKAAIKVNMPLTSEKMQWLIDELMKTHNPMTCPHGRPIMMRFGLREIERGFKRP